MNKQERKLFLFKRTAKTEERVFINLPFFLFPTSQEDYILPALAALIKTKHWAGFGGDTGQSLVKRSVINYF